MVAIVYPDELQKSHWDRKKAELEGVGDLADLLKKLQRKHEGVEWPKWASGWAKGLSSQADLEAAHEALEKLYRAKALPLKFEAAGVASAADKAGRSKELSKAQREAIQQIGKSAAAYGKALDEGLVALDAELKQALKAVPAADDDDEGDSGSALVDPSRLLKQLKLCKADPARTVHFAMVDDGKSDPQLVLHPRQAGRALLARLIKDLGIKTGAFGQASLDGTTLRLMVEKRVSGLVKRIRIPVRACGFRIAKVALVDESGALVEEDLEGEEADTSLAGDGQPDTAASALQAWTSAREAAFATLKVVAKDIADLKDPESADAIKQIGLVLKTLIAEPTTRLQVEQLIRFVDKDEVVQDVSDFAEDIRMPLLKALARMQRAVSV